MEQFKEVQESCVHVLMRCGRHVSKKGLVPNLALEGSKNSKAGWKFEWTEVSQLYLKTSELHELWD